MQKHIQNIKLISVFFRVVQTYLLRLLFLPHTFAIAHITLLVIMSVISKSEAIHLVS